MCSALPCTVAGRVSAGATAHLSICTSVYLHAAQGKRLGKQSLCCNQFLLLALYVLRSTRWLLHRRAQPRARGQPLFPCSPLSPARQRPLAARRCCRRSLSAAGSAGTHEAARLSDTFVFIFCLAAPHAGPPARRTASPQSGPQSPPDRQGALFPSLPALCPRPLLPSTTHAPCPVLTLPLPVPAGVAVWSGSCCARCWATMALRSSPCSVPSSTITLTSAGCCRPRGPSSSRPAGPSARRPPGEGSRAVEGGGRAWRGAGRSQLVLLPQGRGRCGARHRDTALHRQKGGPTLCSVVETQWSYCRQHWRKWR